MKAAILQNSVGIGGRSKVIARTIGVLEKEYDDVHIHTLSTITDIKKFISHYSLDIDSNHFVRYRGNSIPGTIYQQPYLNYRAKKRLKDYDFIYNSNNCMSFLPVGPEYIHYIHFPSKAILESSAKYSKPMYRIATLPFNLFINSADPTISGKVFGNSRFTCDHIDRHYDISDISVCYPPAIESVKFDHFNGCGVVSLGSFHPKKRQLFQIKLAEVFPQIDFHIIGSTSSKTYYNKCIKYIEHNDISNVTVYPDASDNKISELLEQSRIFLHSRKNEHFGISVVEAMNHGCIPVIPDSGGQREIQPDRLFRYENKSECIEAIENAISGEYPDISDIQEHLAQFTEAEYNRIIREELIDLH